MKWVFFLGLVALVGCDEKPSSSNEFSIRQLEEREDVFPSPRDERAEIGRKDSGQKNPLEQEREAVPERLESENRKVLNERIDLLKAELEADHGNGAATVESLTRRAPNGQSPSKPPEADARPKPKAPGNVVRVGGSQTLETLPFGDRLYCRLAGELLVSQFDSFAVIDIFRDGLKVGFAFGEASFLVNDRIAIRVSQVAMDGKLYSGQFQAISLAGSAGLSGKVHRQLGKILLQGILSTLATGLAIQNPGDGLSSLLQANLANNSLDNLASAIQAQQYYQTITVRRQTPFFLVSVGNNRETTQQTQLSDDFRGAFQDALRNPANQDVMQAYQRNLDAQSRRRN